MSRPPVAHRTAPLTMAEALSGSAALGRLGERLRRSKVLFAAVAPLIPPGLVGHVHPGPADEEGWSLLCANAAVAAKLRQLAPRLQQRLHESGFAVAALRIKVQSP